MVMLRTAAIVLVGVWTDATTMMLIIRQICTIAITPPFISCCFTASHVRPPASDHYMGKTTTVPHEGTCPPGMQGTALAKAAGKLCGVYVNWVCNFPIGLDGLAGPCRGASVSLTHQSACTPPRNSAAMHARS